MGLIPGQGTKILHATRHSQKTNRQKTTDLFGLYGRQMDLGEWLWITVNAIRRWSQLQFLAQMKCLYWSTSAQPLAAVVSYWLTWQMLLSPYHFPRTTRSQEYKPWVLLKADIHCLAFRHHLDHWDTVLPSSITLATFCWSDLKKRKQHLVRRLAVNPLLISASYGPIWRQNNTSSLNRIMSLSCVWLFVTLRTAARQAPLSSTISRSLFKVTSIESVMLANHLILSRPLLLLPSVFPSIRVFSKLSLRIRWSKYWCFSFRFSPSNKYSGLISFRIDWFDLPAVQRTLKSLLQHHNLKASSLRCSAFFVVQLSWVQYIRVTLLLCERAGLNTVCKHLQFPLCITFLFHLCF